MSTAPPSNGWADLRFDVVDRFRPFALVAPGFVAVQRDDESLDGPTVAADGPLAPFAAVELRVEEVSGSVHGGLRAPDGNHLLARWDAPRSRVTLEVRRDGRTRTLGAQVLRPTGPLGLAFVLCENRATALVDLGQGWRPVLTARRRVARRFDLRRADELARFRYAWGGDGGTGRLRAGLFGMAGLRDPHLVEHADGTPYERDGRLYLTWTAAGLGFFQQAHWTVWSMDPRRPRDLRLEAHLFSRRDGLVLGDHAGHLVRDGDRWLVALSSWGDFAPGHIHVRHTTTTADLLRGVHVLDTVRTPLPTRYGAWDPTLTREAGQWLVGFVESPRQKPFEFHPALAVTDAAEWTDDLRAAWTATGLELCEGTILSRAAGAPALLASDGAARRYRVFDARTGAPLGQVAATYATNLPHPQLVPDGAGGWWLVTFDGTSYGEEVIGYGGHGDVVVMRSR